MKIALIRQRHTSYGGAEQYVSQLARLLVEGNHEVHLLARHWEGEALEGLHWHRLPPGFGPRFLRLAAFARDVARVVDQIDFDLVQSFERTYSQDLFRAGDGCHREWLARRARAVGAWKGVVDAVNPRHRVWLDLERRLFSDTRLKRVIAISHRVRQDILTHYDYPEENIRVIYNGVDRRRFHAGLRNEYRSRVREELGLEPDEPVALFIGSGFARKGLREAVGALARGRFRLLAAGRDRIGPYERLARRLGVGERLVYLGPRQDVPRLYAAADIFILPGWYEPFGNVILEALASGLPVVTTRDIGGAEAVEEGINGHLVDFPVDPEDLACKMEQTFQLDSEQVRRANERILRTFTWERNLNETLALYREITGD